MRAAILIFLFLLVGGPAWADAEAEARRLSVRAVLLFTQATEAEDPDRRIELLKEAQAALERIVRDFPATDTANRLKGGEGIVVLTPDGKTTLTVERVVSALKVTRCLREVSRVCVLDEAVKTARGIEDASGRAWALARVAAAQAETGKIREALDTARGIEDAVWRAWALAGVAAAQAKLDDREGARRTLDRALDTARGIDRVVSRAVALGMVAAAQAKLGDREGARRTLGEALDTVRQVLESARDARARGSALYHVALVQAWAGDVAGALDTARGIENALFRAAALARAAAAQAKAGDIPGALETARGIEDAGKRAWALQRVAAAQAKAGNILEALDTARGIRGIGAMGWQAEALAKVAAAQAEAQAEAGDISAAVETARSIEYAGERAKALAAIARHLPQ